MIITIDGPSGAGKSTVSRGLAKLLSFTYLDTGAMYRAVALAVYRAGAEIKDHEKLNEICSSVDIRFEGDFDSPHIIMNGEDVSEAIRTPVMDMQASLVSAVPLVREKMTLFQRLTGEKGDIVAEGRDMGTVVFPDADIKFFLTASIAARVERRYQERSAKGKKISKEDIEKDILQRDKQDSSREIAPLAAAKDAIYIDSSEINAEEVINLMLYKIKNTSVLRRTITD